MDNNLAEELESVVITDQEELFPSRSDPKAHYPSGFTSIPIFRPVKHREEFDTNWGEGHHYECLGGAISQFGPGLNIYDQNTYLALLHLASKTKVTETVITKSKNGEDAYLADGLEGLPIESKRIKLRGRVTRYELNDYLNRGRSSPRLEATMASLVRLAKTTIQYRRDPFFKGEVLELAGIEAVTHLLSFKMSTEDDGSIDVEFESGITEMLLAAYAEVDINTKMKLSDVGQSLLIFLSGHKDTKIPIESNELQQILGFAGAPSKFKESLVGSKSKVGQLALMVELGILKSFKVAGTGRKVPITFTFEKASPQTCLLDA